MLISAAAIQHLRQQEIQKHPDERVLIGSPCEYFFMTYNEDSDNVVCGVKAVIIELSKFSTETEVFAADLAILSHVPEMYVRCEDLKVVGRKLTDADGDESICFIEAQHYKEIIQTINDNYRPNSSSLRLVWSNDKKDQ